MAYANFYYCDYNAPRDSFLTQMYKNFQQYSQLFSQRNYGYYANIARPAKFFNICSTDSLSFSGFKFPELPKRKLDIKTKISDIDLNKYKPATGENAIALNEEGFLDKVKEVAKNVNCDYKDLLAVMNAECGLKHHKPNKISGAVGLIQFSKSTAKGLGTSTEELSKMSAIDQLAYVEKFLTKCKKTYKFNKDARLSGADLYSLVYLPARAKRRDVLCYKGETKENGKLLKYYEWNKGMDLNKDGKITKAEIAKRVDKFRVHDIGIA